MSNWELKIGPERPTRNPINGRFLKGHIPQNKGKRWDEYMSKRGQRKALKNLEIGRRVYVRPPNCGRKKKKVIAVNVHGKFLCFNSIKEAGIWTGGRWENIRRCCFVNSLRRALKNVKGEMTDKVNTDHRYMGIRFYFEDDPIWMEKIKK